MRYIAFMLPLAISSVSAQLTVQPERMYSANNNNVSTIQFLTKRITGEIQAFHHDFNALQKIQEPSEEQLQELTDRAAALTAAIDHLSITYPEIFIASSPLLRKLEMHNRQTRNLGSPSNIITELTEVGELLDTFQSKMNPILEEPDISPSYKKIVLVVTLTTQTLLTLAVIAYICFSMYHQGTTPPTTHHPWQAPQDSL